MFKNSWESYDLPDAGSTLARPTRRVAVLAACVSLLSASLMFYGLKIRDSTRFFYAEAPTRALSTAPSPAPTVPATTELPETASTPADAKRTPFKIRRSRRFQSFGALKMRLSRINPRRPDLDVSLNVNGRLIQKRHVGLEQPIVIDGTATAPGMKVVFNRMTRDQAFGYVMDF